MNHPAITALSRATAMLLTLGLFTVGSMPTAGHTFVGAMHWIAHLIIYAMIAFAFGLGWPQRSAAKIAALLVTIGAIHEATEIITHSHGFEIEDGIVNAIGVLIGVAIQRTIATRNRPMNAKLHIDNLCSDHNNSEQQTAKRAEKYPLQPLVILTVLALLAAGLMILGKSTLYYPYLAVTGPGDIRFYFLQRGEKQASQCARILTIQSAAIQGGCPTCRIERGECPSDLDNSKQHWLNEEPIELPSARMAYGVIVFQAAQQHIALSACQESERQSLTNPLVAHIKCFPAGRMRPLLTIEHDILAQEHAETRKSLSLAIAAIVGFITLLIALLALLHRFTAREPTEINDLTETDPFQLAEIKTSNIIKRVSDILLAATLLIALLPILLLVALLIRVLEGSPIFYMSRRIISPEKSVPIYKFRTMVRDATSPKYQLNERFMRDGFLDIPLECEVYTSIGRVLERTQIVETLQLLNILFDGMSFVGNRPLPKNNIELLKKFPGWQERFDSPAGITGISQIAGKYGLQPQQRLYLERMYSNVYNNPDGNIVLCDLYIIGYTALLLFTGRYLGYSKAVALLTRCGADNDLPGYIPHELEFTNVNDD